MGTQSRRLCLVLIVAGVCILPAGFTCLSIRYGLGTLGGSASIPAAVSEDRIVVGGAETADGKWHAFLWSEGAMTDLGTLGGNESEAHAVSDGQELYVVGTSQMPDPCDPCVILERGFLWHNGTMTEVGTLGGCASDAWGVSDSGVVVGASLTAEDDWHAFRWEAGTMTDLGTLGGDHSCALDINNAGKIVGWSMAPGTPVDANDTDPPPVRRAFLWTAGSGMTDLGTLGGLNSTAMAIDDDGRIIGWSDTSYGERHIVLWDPNDGMQHIGTTGGCMAEGWGISAGGIVGWSLDQDGRMHGFWSQPDLMLREIGQPLGGEGPVFVADITGDVVVVGSANTADGDEQAYLRIDKSPTP